MKRSSILVVLLKHFLFGFQDKMPQFLAIKLSFRNDKKPCYVGFNWYLLGVEITLKTSTDWYFQGLIPFFSNKLSWLFYMGVTRAQCTKRGNPIPTSPGLASFGVTSNSGFEVSSFRNLSKRKNLVNSTIQTKLLRTREFNVT